MTDDEALKMSDEMAVIRRAKKQAHATNRHENSNFAQINAISSKANLNSIQPTLMSAANYNFAQQFNTFAMQQSQMDSNSKTSFNVDQQSNTSTGLHAAFNLEQDTQVSSLSENEKRLQRPLQFGMISSDDINSIGQSNTSNLGQTTFNIEQDLIKEQKMHINNKNMGQMKGLKVDQQSIIGTGHGIFNMFPNDEKKKHHYPPRFETQSPFQLHDNSVGEESIPQMDSLSDFTVEQAAQISKLTEDERKLKRAQRFRAQPLQNQQSQKSKVMTKNSQDLEQLRMRVTDFFDTAKLYARVQDEISKKTSNEMTLNESGRARAWDYFDDGLGTELKTEARAKSKMETNMESNIEPKTEPKTEPKMEPKMESLFVYQENLSERKGS
ncbi:hypothetical protein C1645_147623 [Glomus cerebriforme]|uniref:Uncharacterized protein n=1 Tax=Glomus cerebriforme TaxID=658196 RepID=A0A397SX03_9GLOM|nr:hypothetical protein C1645_147623 [Glomus cerebriforme]